MKKITALFFIIALIVPLTACGEDANETKYEEINVEELNQRKELAIREASDLFRKKQEEGMDFSSGPCLAEEVIDDWSADIVHLPRVDEDDKPENQCAHYRTGKTHHFIELSVDGDLVRAK